MNAAAMIAEIATAIATRMTITLRRDLRDDWQLSIDLCFPKWRIVPQDLQVLDGYDPKSLVF